MRTRTELRSRARRACLARACTETLERRTLMSGTPLVSGQVLDLNNSVVATAAGEAGGGAVPTYQIQAGLTAFFSAVGGVTSAGDPTGGTTYAAPATPNNTTFSWNFGDTAPSTRKTWNTLTGYSAAHIYDTPSPAGSPYVLTLTETDLNGNASVVKVNVVVAPNGSGTSAPDVNVGSDDVTHTIFVDTTGATVANAYRNFTTYDAAMAYLNNNPSVNGLQVRFKRGETFTVATSDGNPHNADILIGAYGPTSLPAPVLSDNAGVNVIEPWTVAVGWTVQDLAFAATNGAGTAFKARGAQMAIRDCTFNGLSNDVVNDESVAGLLVENTTDASSVGNYDLHVGGSNLVAIGNTFTGGSQHQPMFRIESNTGETDVTQQFTHALFEGNTLSAENSFDKNTITIRGAEPFTYVANNVCYDGALSIGDVAYHNNDGSFRDINVNQHTWARISGNLVVNGAITATGSTNHLTVDDNVVEDLTGNKTSEGIYLDGGNQRLAGNTVPRLEDADFAVVHNTIYTGSTAATAPFVTFDGGTNLRLLDNLFVAPSGSARPGVSLGIYGTEQGSLSQLTAVGGNAFANTSVVGTAFAQLEPGSSGGATNVSFSAWKAQFATDNVEQVAVDPATALAPSPGLRLSTASLAVQQQSPATIVPVVAAVPDVSTDYSGATWPASQQTAGAVQAVQLTGTVIGTTGTSGHAAASAFDDDPATYFDGPDASGDWVGYDLGAAYPVTQVKFAARPGGEAATVGGQFQGSNSPTFATGVTTLYTVAVAPAAGVLTVAATGATGTYRYVRYLGPSGSHGDVAEASFYEGTAASPATGTVSGTVFDDANGNGTKDAGEAGFTDVPVAVYLDLNGNGVPDAGEPTTATANGTGNFSFGGVAAGTYQVREVVPAGQQQTTPAAGYVPATVTAGSTVFGVTFGNRPGQLVLNGAGGFGTVYLKRDAGNAALVDLWTSPPPFTGSPAAQYAPGDYSAVVVAGSASGTALTLDDSAGPVAPAGGLSFNGAGGATNTLTAIGTSGADSFQDSATAVTINGVAATFANVAQVVVDPLAGPDSLAVTGGTTTIPAGLAGGGIVTRQFSSLSVAAGAKLAVVAPPANHSDRTVLVAGSLSVAAGGTLDLGGNDMIVHNGNDSGSGGTAAVTANFAGGNGSTGVDQYPGVAGGGWATAWAPQQYNEASTSATTATATPLNNGGTYLSFSDKSSSTASASAPSLAGESRQFGTGSGLDPTQPYAVAFDYRLDGPTASLTTTGDRVALFGDGQASYGTSSGNSWLISAYGAANGNLPALTWGFENGDKNGDANQPFVTTGVPLTTGHVYHFAVSVNPSALTYNAVVTDVTAGTAAVEKDGLGFRTGTAAGTTYLNFADRHAEAGAADQWSLDSVAVTQALASQSLNALVASGYGAAGGPWTGTGITSSAAAGDPRHLTALGVAPNVFGGQQLYASFDGVAVTTTDVLVKYTYYGDANLDGKVDGSDYSRIDAGSNSESTPTPLTGWFNGDFNYDTTINGSDYTLIDNAFNTQGAQL